MFCVTYRHSRTFLNQNKEGGDYAFCRQSERIKAGVYDFKMIKLNINSSF